MYRLICMIERRAAIISTIHFLNNFWQITQLAKSSLFWTVLKLLFTIRWLKIISKLFLQYRGECNAKIIGLMRTSKWQICCIKYNNWNDNRAITNRDVLNYNTFVCIILFKQIPKDKGWFLRNPVLR